MKVLPKIIQLLELFAKGDTLTFAEIVERTKLTRSNAAHLLTALCQQELLIKSSFGRYQTGSRLFELTGGNSQQNLLYMLAQRAADRIAGELNELGTVAAFWRNNRVTLAKVQPESMVQLSIADRWFEKSGWYRLSSGRLLLALQSNEVIEEIVDAVGMPTAGEWPEAFSRENFFCEIEKIRQMRCATVLRENNRLTSLAIPVKDASNCDTLCVSTVYITSQHQQDNEDIKAHLRKIADDMQQQISFHRISIKNIIPDITNKESKL